MTQFLCESRLCFLFFIFLTLTQWSLGSILGVGGINGVESGPFELQELTKSPYKMYERNPHTKCMREKSPYKM